MCLPVSHLVCPDLYTGRMHTLYVDQINSFHYWRVSMQLMSGGARHWVRHAWSSSAVENRFWTFHCLCCIFHFIYLTVSISPNNGDTHFSGTMQQASSSVSCKNMVSYKQTRLLPQIFLINPPEAFIFHFTCKVCILCCLLACVTATSLRGKLVTQGWEAWVKKGASIIKSETS